jgi:protein FAM32A
MSGYENVVGGKLKLKGKALDVKAGGVKKKKKNKNIRIKFLKLQKMNFQQVGCSSPTKA